MTPSKAPTYDEIAFDDGLAAWATSLDGLTKYWTGVLARGATPLDVAIDAAGWWRAVSERRAPSWTTAHEIAFEAPLARLRDFSTAGRRARVVPTLVLPPQAGHDSCIVDYSEEQSQIRTILAAGLDRAYALDWIGATRSTKDATVDDYLDVIDRAVDHAGGHVNLIGDCQGGWLATIYAALRPEHVNTLTIAGAPIDFHAGEPVIHAAMTHFAPGGDLAFYRGLVAAGGGVLKGEQMLAAFVLIGPENEITRQMGLLANIRDPKHTARYRVFEDWFKHTQDIPGAFYLWIVEHLFRDNDLLHGRLEIAGERVDLSRIDCPLNLLAGAADHITPPDQVFALQEATSTPADRVLRELTEGGHLGLFMGHEALREHWPRLLERVALESRPKR